MSDIKQLLTWQKINIKININNGNNILLTKEFCSFPGLRT